MISQIDRSPFKNGVSGVGEQQVLKITDKKGDRGRQVYAKSDIITKKNMYKFLFFAYFWSAQQEQSFGQHSGGTSPVPRRRGNQWGMPRPLIFWKSDFDRDVFLKICFCDVLQGIQNVFGSQNLVRGTMVVLFQAFIYLFFIQN